MRPSQILLCFRKREGDNATQSEAVPHIPIIKARIRKQLSTITTPVNTTENALNNKIEPHVWHNP